MSFNTQIIISRLGNTTTVQCVGIITTDVEDIYYMSIKCVITCMLICCFYNKTTVLCNSIDVRY